MSDTLLDIRGLTTRFSSPQGIAKAVDTVSLSLMQGETLAVVGESGCGKTVLALSILGLVPDPPGRVTDGSVLYQGRDLLDMDESELRRIRGNQISMIFQEPMTALNPVFRIDDQIAEPLRLHQRLDRRAALAGAVDALALVGIPNPAKVARAYPHELSGGMRQRVMIAMALACNPAILIADEPTTALDVTVQAQIIDLMNDLKARMNGSLMLITHDLGVVARMAGRVAVMYAGKVVELCDVGPLFAKPLHPYTQGLLASVPVLGDRTELNPIPGIVPGIFDLPEGCRFRPRCQRAFDRCTTLPPLLEAEPGRQVRCWLYE
ncbi:MAG: ABC transporter ATP-binding protein [Pseudodesulfovibrio sp.]|uniref:Oligopeptide/dipeptide ABC transporter, ATPase subunit n=1 Tax=Pseudodesulfovibrio aespoeensis (strain ATCC 700646 / DSM 10631 / Aspo-2) TaxID=643562 RepID=E6VYK8_PSEA9|nr:MULTISPECIES: ABC transporter ATP-binding protein [Pseudodesulfovibrio]MBU4192459.1 ABC transporter ATP-binding protein [Pseudomonadota bacterium]ADU62771.1 oligopeptide/dipeptide ABC transporter, ATPase subunit [Pseudodesulfovibrio aespoeensis Aspo-2]MBU4242787.1 ABC transporter ATP-binding protein [Pseudomonadota bacterium]MBU4377541.1 ABC transporter ATP-binding protein [Pseudomonadota bacterium]MBU4474179.1 ABC transporter ATP-binding protein [Pseudomonadota bacterium]